MSVVSGNPPPDVVKLLDDMLSADGYHAVVHAWPTTTGHAKVEIVAGEHACVECLVPKGLLAKVLASVLPAGVLLEAEDIDYPEAAAPESSH